MRTHSPFREEKRVCRWHNPIPQGLGQCLFPGCLAVADRFLAVRHERTSLFKENGLRGVVVNVRRRKNRVSRKNDATKTEPEMGAGASRAGSETSRRSTLASSSLITQRPPLRFVSSATMFCRSSPHSCRACTRPEMVPISRRLTNTMGSLTSSLLRWDIMLRTGSDETMRTTRAPYMECLFPT